MKNIDCDKLVSTDERENHGEFDEEDKRWHQLTDEVRV